MIQRLLAPLFPVTGEAPRLPQDRDEWLWLVLAVVSTWPTGMALGSGLAAITAVLASQMGAFPYVFAAAIALQAAIGFGLTLVALLWPGARRGLVALFEALWLVVLPLWGLGIDLALPDCAPCGDQNRALGVPGVAFLYAVYALAVLAYVVSRRRPARLSDLAEGLIAGALGAGVLTCLLLVVQFGGTAVMGLVFGLVGLPLVAPGVVAGLFLVQLALRVRRGAARPVAVGLAATAGITAVDVGAHVAVLGSPEVFAGALSQTCGWTLSQLEPPPADCHYLCTVAARGHPWLVRPQRLGRRRGRVIVVNRQLAVANAFEDLLHERWPRFGRAARTTYDRVGLPISAYIRHPVASDLVFLAMLPAQAGFELFLRAVDADPEARIDRMYR